MEGGNKQIFMNSILLSCPPNFRTLPTWTWHAMKQYILLVQINEVAVLQPIGDAAGFVARDGHSEPSLSVLLQASTIRWVVHGRVHDVGAVAQRAHPTRHRGSEKCLDTRVVLENEF